MPDLADLEARIVALAADADALFQRGEAATRQAAVDPVLRELGWDTSRLDEVDPEYSDRSGGKVDYGLRHGSRVLAFVEAKAAGTKLDTQQEQLLRYVFGEGVTLAALTDGLEWWLYLPMAPGRGWEQRRFARIDFRKQDAASAAAALHRFLNRDDSVSGVALREAEHELERQERAVRVRAELREGWQQVLGEPRQGIRELLARTVDELSAADLAAFLTEVLEGSAPQVVQPPVQRVPPEDGSGPTLFPPDADFTGRRPAAFWVGDNRYQATRWNELLRGTCEQLAQRAGPAFRKHVAHLKGRKRPYFTPSAADLREALSIPGTDLYVEGHFSANDCVRLARRVVEAVRGTDDSFRIELAE